MNVRNKKPFFPYPIRGLGVVAIFLIIAPPVHAVVEALRLHAWAGGYQLFLEVTDVLWNSALPKVLPAYSVYMPPVFVAGLWSAYTPARGGGLTIGGAIGRMVMAGFVFELIFQSVLLVMGGAFINEQLITTRLLQWVFSGWISWIMAAVFRLDKPVGQ